MRLGRKLTGKRILAGLCLLSVALMFLPGGQRLRRVARPVVAPLGHLGMSLPVHLRTRVAEIAGRGGAGADPLPPALEAELLALRQELARRRRQVEALSRWRSVLRGFPCRLIPARVVASDPLPMRDRRLIGAGSRQGLRAGDMVTTRRLIHEADVALPEKLTVLGRNYVVGRIVDCAAYTATLQLVTDPGFRMSAKLWRFVYPGQERTIYLPGRDGGLEPRTFRHDGSSPLPQAVGRPVDVRAEGDGRRIVLRQVPANHGIRPGDMLTSGDSPAVPLGMTIGRVSEVRRDRDAAHYVTVFVEPLGKLARLREVYVLMPRSREGG